MKRVTLLELRRTAARIIAQIQRGQRLILNRRGKPVARLEPNGAQRATTRGLTN